MFFYAFHILLHHLLPYPCTTKSTWKLLTSTTFWLNVILFKCPNFYSNKTVLGFFIGHQRRWDRLILNSEMAPNYNQWWRPRWNLLAVIKWLKWYWEESVLAGESHQQFVAALDDREKWTLRCGTGAGRGRRSLKIYCHWYMIYGCYSTSLVWHSPHVSTTYVFYVVLARH